jgi:hypothetical protein
MEIRYEELVARPNEVLAEACAFAQLPFDERMLDYHVDASERIEWRAGKEFHSGATKPPASGARDWRSEMPVSDVRVFEAVAGGLLDELGYGRQYASVPLALRLQSAMRNTAFRAWTAGSRIKKATSEATGRSKPASIDRAIDGA